MVKKLCLASALGLALLSSSVSANTNANTQAITPTIAVVNLPLIMLDIPQAKIVEETLSKEFASRGQELQKLQEKGVKLGQDINAGKFKGDTLTQKQRELAQLQADFQLKARAFNEDQQKRTQEEQRKLVVIVQKAIDTIARERNIDLVLRGDIVLYTVDALDISKEVLELASRDKTGFTQK